MDLGEEVFEVGAGSRRVSPLARHLIIDLPISLFAGCFVAAMFVQALGREAFIVDPVFYIIAAVIGLIAFGLLAGFTRRTLAEGAKERIRIFERGVEFTYGQDGRGVCRAAKFKDIEQLYFGEKSELKRAAVRAVGGRSVATVARLRLTAEISDGTVIRYQGAGLSFDSADLSRLIKHWKRAKAGSSPE